MKEKLQHISTVKTSGVLCVVTNAETGKVGRGALKATMHNFKGDEGLSEECKNDCELEVNKGKLLLSLPLFFLL